MTAGTPCLNEPNARTEAQAREERLHAERRRWFPAFHANGEFGILSHRGSEIAHCKSEQDRDFIMTAIREKLARDAAAQQDDELNPGGILAL